MDDRLALIPRKDLPDVRDRVSEKISEVDFTKGTLLSCRDRTEKHLDCRSDYNFV